MKRILELEAWTIPGKLLPADYGKNIQEDIWSEGIPRSVFLGLSSIPDSIDSRNLLRAIDSGELSIDSFNQFCLENKLPQDPQDIKSAALFIEYSWGKRIAWIHIPEGEEYLIEKIKCQMNKRDLILINPNL